MKTITCIASGPSLTQAQVNRAHEISDLVIAVNDAYRLVPQQGAGSVLYGADVKWWKYHWPHIQENWVGECHTQKLHWPEQDLETIGFNKVWDIEVSKPGLSTDPTVIHGGGNSGYQALNIAALMAAPDARIFLIGYDMGTHGGMHFFGDHPNRWAQGGYSRFVAAYRGIRDDRIINCTPGSALDWFPSGEITHL